MSKKIPVVFGQILALQTTLKPDHSLVPELQDWHKYLSDRAERSKDSSYTLHPASPFKGVLLASPADQEGNVTLLGTDPSNPIVLSRSDQTVAQISRDETGAVLDWGLRIRRKVDNQLFSLDTRPDYTLLSTSATSLVGVVAREDGSIRWAVLNLMDTPPRARPSFSVKRPQISLSARRRTPSTPRDIIAAKRRLEQGREDSSTPSAHL